MALHPEAECSDILLAGFLSGFVEELGPPLLMMPPTAPVLPLAQAAYHWAEERPAEALKVLEAVPADSAERRAADRLRAQFSGTVTVLSLSGSPGGAAMAISSLHRHRADPGPGLRICTAGLREDDDLLLGDDRPLLPALAAQGIRPDLVYNVLEDAFVPADFDALACCKATVLADMHHHVLRHNDYYSRHDLLLAQSRVQHDLARRIYRRKTVYMPNADAIFEDLAPQSPEVGKSIDFSYGGSLLRYLGRKKQQYLWPIVNGPLDRSILAYQGRFEDATYERLQDASRHTASFSDFADFIVQPRTFEYLRKGAGLVMPDDRFHRLLLSPLGVPVQPLATFCGDEDGLPFPAIDRGGDPSSPAPSGAPRIATGYAKGREQYRALAARYGVRPTAALREGRRSLRRTLALCLFHAARTTPAHRDPAPAPDRHWCPHFAGREAALDGLVAARLAALRDRCRSAGDYNAAWLLCRRLQQAHYPAKQDEGGGIAAAAPQPADLPGPARTELWTIGLQLAADAMAQHPHSALFLLRYLTTRFGQHLPELPPAEHPEIRDLVDRKMREERLRFLNGTPQPILDLGPANDDRHFGVCGLADSYMRLRASQGKGAAEAELSQAMRRAALAQLCLLSGELHRHADDPALALPAYLQALTWWHRHPSAYIPVLLILRHWPAEVVARHLEPSEVLARIAEVLNDAPEVLRAAGPDLAAFCHAIGDHRRASEYVDLWFRWMYRVVSSEGPLFGPRAMSRVRSMKHYWPLWVTNRLHGRTGQTIRLPEEFVDYSGFENALRDEAQP